MTCSRKIHKQYNKKINGFDSKHKNLENSLQKRLVCRLFTTNIMTPPSSQNDMEIMLLFKHDEIRNIEKYGLKKYICLK